MSCRRCGAEWVVYAQLAALATPKLPREFAAQCEALAVAQVPAIPGRRAGRMILLGTLFVVAAAASTLAWLIDSPQPASPPEPGVAAAPASVEQPESAVAVVDSPAPVVGEPVSIEVLPTPKEIAATPFTVRMLPLQNELKNPPGREAVASTYAAILKQLRAVPGLNLVESDSAGSATETGPVYRVTILASDTGSDTRIPVTMRAESQKADGPASSSMVIDGILGIGPDCKASDSACVPPDGVAEHLVGYLRKMMFPKDVSMERRMQASVIDRSLDEHRRLQALRDLASIAATRSGNAGKSSNDLLGNPDVLRGAIDLASVAADPKVRAAIWEIVRGIGNSELIPPLLAALGRDSDSGVRMTALGTLSADFSDDPRVRAALEASASRDARPLVRALALRAAGGTTGAAAWKEYVITSLEDPLRPPMERIEALFMQMGLAANGSYGYAPTGSFNPDRTLHLLDNDSIKALAEVLPQAGRDSSSVRNSSSALVRALASIDHPAITEMLLASLQDGSSWLDRGVAAQALGALPSRRDDVRVHAALEKISSSDSNPQFRQAASAALQPQAGPQAGAAASQTPPGLGVFAGPVQAGPYVPRELLGKAHLNNVMPGSVGESAGVRAGDVLLELGGEAVASPRELYRILATIPAGSEVDVVVYRFGGKVTLKAHF